MSYKTKIISTVEGGTGSSISSPTARKILVSDATNFVASTETWAAPGASGNYLTSDGTNWISSPISFGIGYVLTMQCASGNPADATTYFIGQNTTLTSLTTSGTASSKLYIPKAGTVTAIYGTFTVGGTLASSGSTSVNLRLNNTTDTLITSAAVMTSADNAFNNASLSISVSAGDYLELKITTPTWATNPTTVRCSYSLYIS